MDGIIDNLSFAPGVNIDDSRFTDAQVAAAEAIVAEFVSSRHPSLDVTRGTTFYDMVVRPTAMIYLTARAQIQADQATRSIKGIQENPELASDAILEAILSNFQVKRRTGAAATGIIKVSVSRSTSYSVSTSQVFSTASGVRLRPASAIIATPTPSEPNHVRLYAADSSNTQWYFLVPVVAEEIGLGSQLTGQVEVSPAQTIQNFVSAFTFGDFSGAFDDESSDELIERIPAALSAKNRVSRIAIKSELSEAFPQVRSVGIQGFGDLGLIRGGGNILGIKSGGYADIWVRTSVSVERREFRLLSSKIGTDPSGQNVYSVTIGASLFPGHYFASAVRPDDEQGPYLGSYYISQQQKSVSPGLGLNELTGTYTRHQSTEVIFLVDPAEGGPDEMAVIVEVMGLPSISEIQDFISDSESRPAGANYLVRAAIPCFVACSPITVRMGQEVNPGDVQMAIYRHINEIKPGEPIRIDGIVMAARSVQGVTSVELPVRIMGRVFAPGGSIIDISSENALIVPQDPSVQLVPESVAFFASLDDIQINSIFE